MATPIYQPSGQMTAKLRELERGSGHSKTNRHPDFFISRTTRGVVIKPRAKPGSRVTVDQPRWS